TAVALRFFEGRSPRAIGKLRGQSAATARQHVHRGLAMLRGRLDREFGQRRAWLAAFASLGLLEPVRPLLPVAPANPGYVPLAVLAAAAVAGTAWPTRASRASPPSPSPPPRDDADPAARMDLSPASPQGPETASTPPPDAALLRARVDDYLQPLVRMGAFAGS